MNTITQQKPNSGPWDGFISGIQEIDWNRRNFTREARAAFAKAIWHDIPGEVAVEAIHKTLVQTNVPVNSQVLWNLWFSTREELTTHTCRNESEAILS